MPILTNQNETYQSSVERRHIHAKAVNRHIFWLWTKDIDSARNSRILYLLFPTNCNLLAWRLPTTLSIQRSRSLLNTANSSFPYLLVVRPSSWKRYFYYPNRTWYMSTYPLDLQHRMESADSALCSCKVRGGGRIMRCRAWIDTNFIRLLLQRDGGSD